MGVSKFSPASQRGVDATPTASSTNLVESGGVKSALDNKADASSLSGILISRKFSTTFSAAPGADGFQFYITAAPQGYTPIFACVETFQGPVISSIASNITKSTTSVVIGIYNCMTSNYTATYFLRILYMKDEFVTTTAFDS